MSKSSALKGAGNDWVDLFPLTLRCLYFSGALASVIIYRSALGVNTCFRSTLSSVLSWGVYKWSWGVCKWVCYTVGLSWSSNSVDSIDWNCLLFSGFASFMICLLGLRGSLFSFSWYVLICELVKSFIGTLFRLLLSYWGISDLLIRNPRSCPSPASIPIDYFVGIFCSVNKLVYFVGILWSNYKFD